ncbi:hypothetical protein SeLEV6574_g04912 [Synchytrium endobioticum]|uniref:Metaxin glutathione S-transferase domain-containing protein n=1 Tax=Synchytrium endobioticum TaxID=286115 RepID=A0A507CXD0_9FUNG|nr:hypothetical protein SeLEV6574_g04912 [Synchytrium endobioticum]
MESITSRLESIHRAFPIHTFPAPHTPAPHGGAPVLHIFPTKSRGARVWGDGHASLDVECVRYQALAAFSNYTCQLQQTFCHDASPTGRLPFLVTPDGAVHGGRDIEGVVTREAGDIDARLSEPDRADCRTYAALVDAKITLALMYSLWMDEDNMTKYTSLLHGSFYVPLLGRWVARSLRSKIMVWIESRRPSVARDEVYEEARTALSALSTRLGASLYFFGTKPTTLDAIVFANLHVILSSRTPHAELFQAVNRHDNLVQYTRRKHWMRQNYRIAEYIREYGDLYEEQNI